MSTLEGKTSFLMILSRKTYAKKIGFGVACLALSAVKTFGKLPGVRICVAIGTTLKSRNMKSEFSARVLLLVVVLMARIAFQNCMFSLQRELCRVVGKFGFRYGMKGLRCMACRTLLFEFPFVRVVVTSAARSKFHLSVTDRLASLSVVL